MSKAILQIVGLLLLILGIVGTGWYWLERIHVLPTNITLDIMHLFQKSNTDIEEVSLSDDNLLLDKLRLEKKEEQLKNIQVNLSRQELEIESQKQSLADGFASIEATRAGIIAMKKQLNQISNQIENKNERIRQTAIALMNMPPQNAVDILQEYDDELIIETFLAVNQISEEQGNASIVPYWLSLMDVRRAGDVQEKIVYNGR